LFLLLVALILLVYVPPSGLLLLQFGTHDVVALKPNKADVGSASLGQGVVYRLKVPGSHPRIVGCLCLCS
jgi:hypothetical protein